MPLRSSSAPVFGTILSPFSDCPNRESESLHSNKQSQFSDRHNPKLLFSHGVHRHLNLTSFSCSSSPQSHSGITEFNPESNSLGVKAIRRVHSDGSLEGLVYRSCDMEGYLNSVTPEKYSYQHNNSMLETAPSFSIFRSESYKFQDGMIRMRDLDQEPLERTITIGEDIGGDFCFGKKGMGLIEEKVEEEEEGFDGNAQPPSPPMYLAAGLGVGSAGFGTHVWDDDISMANVDESGGNAEEYYERMVDEYPCHPLFLKNYAHALQSKGDFHGAEEYYFRTTQANPSDGEALLQYGKLVWQLHHDQDRASSYFERAAQASPQDSSVLAAYASFLWEIEDDLDEDKACRDQSQADKGDMADTTAAGSKRGDNPEENYKKMIEENPNNALLLRNYAQFCQSKGDLQGADKYYLQAILADPKDGEIMVQYAKLVWELHHDSQKALGYFERAAQANPEDSYILAAYAHFLWESGDDEEVRGTQGHIEVPLVQGGAVSSGNA